MYDLLFNFIRLFLLLTLTNGSHLLLDVTGQAEGGILLGCEHEVVGMGGGVHVFLVMHVVTGGTGHVPGTVGRIDVETVGNLDAPGVVRIDQVVGSSTNPGIFLGQAPDT